MERMNGRVGGSELEVLPGFGLVSSGQQLYRAARVHVENAEWRCCGRWVRAALLSGAGVEFRHAFDMHGEFRPEYVGVYACDEGDARRLWSCYWRLAANGFIHEGHEGTRRR